MEWLTNFKTSNNVVFEQVCGESGAVDAQKRSVRMMIIPKLIQNYSLDDIFLCGRNKTIFFFKFFPEKTFVLKDQSRSGG